MSGTSRPGGFPLAGPAPREAQVAVRYVIKWLPKDQDVVIDHTTRYDDPSLALTVARNLLQLHPRKIWVEDENGGMHTDHEDIVNHGGN